MKLRKVISLVIVVTLVISAIQLYSSENTIAKTKGYVKKISVTKKSFTLKKGTKKTIAVKIKVVKNVSKKFTAKVKNKKIAKIKVKKNKIVVNAKKVGKTKILIKTKAKGKKGKKLKKTIRVNITSTKLMTNFGELESDCTDFVMGEKALAHFTASAKNVQGKFKLYENNKVISEMNDSGVNGDENANDGVFSCNAYVFSSNSIRNKYFAEADNGKTSDLIIDFYKEMSEEDSNRLYENTREDINSISDNYSDYYGYVEKNNVQSALTAVERYAKEIVNTGDARHYEKNQGNIIIKLKSGESIAYIPKVEGFDSAGSDVEIDITTCQPSLRGYDYALDCMDLPDKAARTLTDTFDNTSFNRDYDNWEVDLDAIDSFSKNEIVIWHGHGGYSKKLHSFLVTGEQHYPEHSRSFDTYVEDGIVFSTDDDVMITSRYIKKNCGDLSGSLFYLGACESGDDKELANSFINKGAQAVVVNKFSILTEYNLKIQNKIISNLSRFDENTNNFYSLNDAIVKAKSQVGYSDKEYGGDGAFPYIVGGNAARNYRVGEIKHEMGGYDIVLTWGEDPSDLDSHMVGYFDNGDYFHVYYNNKTEYYQGNKICELDYDDTTSYGPEVTSVNTDKTTACYYYIYRYAGYGTVSGSNAVVRLYKDGVLKKTFYVPSNEGDDDYWNVFAIKDGQIIEKNTITSSPDTSY